MMKLFWNLIAGLYSVTLMAIIAMLNRIAACVAKDFEAIRLAENVAMVFFALMLVFCAAIWIVRYQILRQTRSEKH